MQSKLLSAIVGGALVVLSFSSPAWSAETIKLNFISGYPPVVGSVKAVLEFFSPEVNKRLAASGSKYQIEWNQAHGGTVAKPTGVFEALEDGVGDLGLVVVIFENSRLPLQNITFAAPFGSSDCATTGEVIHELHKTVPAMAEAWNKAGQVYLSTAPVDSYNVISKKPIKSVADLKGLKVGASGMLGSWIKGTGATAVSTTGPEVYNALKTGLIDAQIIFTTFMRGFKLHEAGPYLTQVGFGSMTTVAMSMNKGRFDGLPEDVRKTILEVADEYIGVAAKNYCGRVDASVDFMTKEGLTVFKLSEAERAQWANTLPNVAQEWADNLEKEGLPGRQVLSAYMESLRKRNVPIPRDWDK